jgi:hypothetical protein
MIDFVLAIGAGALIAGAVIACGLAGIGRLRGPKP